jgi:hypothetical protein
MRIKAKTYKYTYYTVNVFFSILFTAILYIATFHEADIKAKADSVIVKETLKKSESFKNDSLALLDIAIQKAEQIDEKAISLKNKTSDLVHKVSENEKVSKVVSFFNSKIKQKTKDDLNKSINEVKTDLDESGINSKNAESKSVAFLKSKKEQLENFQLDEDTIKKVLEGENLGFENKFIIAFLDKVRNHYSNTLHNLLKDISIFSGTNLFIFLVFVIAGLTTKRLREMYIPSVIAFITVSLVASYYIFGQDWVSVILYNDYLGWGYTFILIIIFLFQIDIIVNGGKATLAVMENLGEVGLDIVID